MPRPRLLKRVFAIDVEHCPQCGDALKIIAAIEEPAVIAKIARFSPKAMRLTVCRAGDRVADSEKDGLNFLFAGPPNTLVHACAPAGVTAILGEH